MKTAVSCLILSVQELFLINLMEYILDHEVKSLYKVFYEKIILQENSVRTPFVVLLVSSLPIYHFSHRSCSTPADVNYKVNKETQALCREFFFFNLVRKKCIW